jgi:hypothetical protein
VSVPATTAVWEHSKVRGADLVTMLAIADAANADGRNAYPGMPRLERFTRRNRRAVLASIRRCLETGELEQTGKAHRGTVAAYAIILPCLATYEEKDARNDTLSEDERVQSYIQKGAEKNAKGAGLRDPLLISKPITTEQTSRARAFQTFWERYPARHGRKLAKGKAEDQWKKLKPAEREQAVFAARQYAQACARGETLAKDAFRWLRDKSFEDWAQTATRVPTPNGAGPAHNRTFTPPPRRDELSCEHSTPMCEDCKANLDRLARETVEFARGIK